MAEMLNLIDKRTHDFGKPGTFPFEVLAFESQDEWDSTEGEPALRRMIVAKFRVKDDAIACARTLAERTYFYKVIVRG